jgi:hypothetical protein
MNVSVERTPPKDNVVTVSFPADALAFVRDVTPFFTCKYLIVPWLSINLIEPDGTAVVLE